MSGSVKIAHLCRYSANVATEECGTNERAPHAPTKLCSQNPVATGFGPQASLLTPSLKSNGRRKDGKPSRAPLEPTGQVAVSSTCLPAFLDPPLGGP